MFSSLLYYSYAPVGVGVRWSRLHLASNKITGIDESYEVPFTYAEAPQAASALVL